MKIERKSNIPDRELTLSIHIQKAGGLSLARVLTAMLGDDAVLFYYHNSFYTKQHSRGDSNEYQQELAPLSVLLRERLLNSPIGKQVSLWLSQFVVKPPDLLGSFPVDSDVKVVHGHFRIPPELADEYRLITVMREPLDRLRSMYAYCRTLDDRGEVVPRWWHSRMSFMEMVNLRHLQNQQSRYLNDIPLEAFTYVGVTDQLNSYITGLSRLFNVPEPELPHVNRSNPLKLNLTPAERQRVEVLNRTDFALYDQVLARIDTQKKSLNTTIFS